MNSKEIQLCGYSGLDWAGTMDDKKSTISYLFSGTEAVSWISKEHVATHSSTEGEYTATVKEEGEEV